MTKRESDILYFVSFCIEQYKNYKHMAGREVVDLFDQYHITDYLYNHYDVLHTQGAQWLLEEIEEIIEEGKGG